MSEPLEDRVCCFVAKERGVRREELSPNSTLGHDLGLDGDDAVEFFEAFKKDFSVDLDSLNQDWDSYFGPEGLSFSAGLLWLVPSALTAFLLIRVFPVVPDWVWFVMSFVLWFLVLAYWQSWRSRRSPQITVQDLIDSAKNGKWTKDLSTPT